VNTSDRIFIKPILSLDKSVLTNEQIEELNGSIDPNATEIIVNGVTYYKTIYNRYLCLTEDDLCTTASEIDFGVDYESNFRMYTGNDPITYEGSNPIDHPDLHDDFVYYFTDDEISSIINRPGLLHISTGDKLIPLIRPTNTLFDDLTRLDCRIVSKDDLIELLEAIRFGSNAYIINGNLVSIGFNNSVISLFNGNEVNSIELSDISNLESYAETLFDACYDLEEEMQIQSTNKEIVNNGDIGDYVSLPEHNGLIELIVTYILDDSRSNITYNEINLEHDNSDDPYLYYASRSRIMDHKMYVDELGEEPIMFNGYHITYGEFPELCERFIIDHMQSYLETSNFIIQIKESNILVLSKNKYISEYKISSCKLLDYDN